jgi:hypothetical protein
MEGKMEQRVCIKFSVKFGKSATETVEMFREASGEHFLSRTRPVKCQLKMMNVQGDQAPAKR